MTVPVACPIPAADASSVQPRKRRRRAPASGASDDCFACSKRSVKCDRRRPYCSQCLEIGSECAGYKTQLTWGVGVASRGKLRGLSLPIAKSAPAARSPPRSRPRPTPSSRRHSQSRKNGGVNDEDADVKLERDIPRAATSYTNYDFINMVPNSPHSPMHAPSSGTDWTMSISQEPLPPPSLPIPGAVEQPSHQQLLRQSLQRLHTPMMRYGDDMSLSTSAGSISGYSDNEYSPLAQSFTAEDVPYLGSPIPMYNSFSSHDSPVDHSSSYGMSVDPRGPTSCPDHFYPQSEVSSSLSSHPTIYEMGENRHLAASPAACNMSDVSYDDDTMGEH